jgi:hypothetical protein
MAAADRDGLTVEASKMWGLDALAASGTGSSSSRSGARTSSCTPVHWRRPARARATVARRLCTVGGFYRHAGDNTQVALPGSPSKKGHEVGSHSLTRPPGPAGLAAPSWRKAPAYGRLPPRRRPSSASPAWAHAISKPLLIRPDPSRPGAVTRMPSRSITATSLSNWPLSSLERVTFVGTVCFGSAASWGHGSRGCCIR